MALEELQCPFCDYATYHPDFLDDHMKQHQGELNTMERLNKEHKQSLEEEKP